MAAGDGSGGGPRRLGVLTPSSNTVLEPAMMRLGAPIADRLSLHFSRFAVTEVRNRARSDQQFEPGPMIAAAELLADARVDAILWAGTSGAWRGLEAEDRLLAGITRETGLPATSATLALIAALERLGVRRYALLVPYIEPVTSAIIATLAGPGYECVASDMDGLTENWAFSQVTTDALTARVRALASHRPDAIVIHCTNLRGAELDEALEAELDVAILDSVVVGLWGALRMLDVEIPATGFGRLGRLGGVASAGTDGMPGSAAAVLAASHG
jgi:maleate isomerase